MGCKSGNSKEAAVPKTNLAIADAISRHMKFNPDETKIYLRIII